MGFQPNCILLIAFLSWPSSAMAARKYSSYERQFKNIPTHANMIIAVQSGLLPVRGPIVLDHALSSQELSQVWTNLPNWGDPMAANSVDRLEQEANGLLKAEGKVALLPLPDGWFLCPR